ncbi:hypothetical protein TPHA_0G01300 [Tetrapisispora phaffii CBS 4417]|uniref:Phosphoglycerate mutase-like protein n=1 Tax=Tetrapisispora phaffii (strain ATCC 24235 / CBS 4417 / NBRC 1672 / NRRL Y-8282 / UCD 70-5) TaxID=1071381 RepID=G8BVN9_TETPH|nr:hypothetical protein TPHA_0G01300 [Tetrapisispora phaffii CBS 4417]CCE63967.1 hypothetical protein TPHA_0G01300 [Tetrapisispora phaffii CBS 4417]
MTKSGQYYCANEDSNVVRVFVVRHGQTDHNVQKILQGHKDIPLNITGYQQAQKLGTYLKENEYFFDKIVSSDLIRCKETISTILKTEGRTDDVPVEYHCELRERFMGVIEGMHISEAEAYADKFGKGSFREFGEPENEFMDRLIGQIQKSIDSAVTSKKRNMGLISHGGSIRTILKWLNYDPENSHKIIVFNTSVTILDYVIDEKKIVVRDVGNTKHLGNGEFVVSDLRLR